MSTLNGHLKRFPKDAVSTREGDEPPTVDGSTLRILSAQEDEAKSGTKSYIVNGKMAGGFAVLATPEKYGKTGMMTFVPSREGAVHAQDLEPKTVEIASFIKDTTLRKAGRQSNRYRWHRDAMLDKSCLLNRSGSRTGNDTRTAA